MSCGQGDSDHVRVGYIMVVSKYTQDEIQLRLHILDLPLRLLIHRIDHPGLRLHHEIIKHLGIQRV